MNLPRVDAALETCERHLVSTRSFSTEVEAILTAYVSAVAYSAFESKARAIVAERAGREPGDEHLANFARTAATRLMRSIKIGELAGAAAWFHGDCKARFQAAIDPEAHAAWDSIINNRHGVAHEDEDGMGSAISNLTFSEFKDMYPKALTVLDCLRSAIAYEEEQHESALTGPSPGPGTLAGMLAKARTYVPKRRAGTS
jgi:hypothetical protein